jgi:hypothetical protein
VPLDIPLTDADAHLWNLQGLSLKAWTGASVRSRSLLALGLAALVSSTVVIGLGDAMAVRT